MFGWHCLIAMNISPCEWHAWTGHHFGWLFNILYLTIVLFWVTHTNACIEHDTRMITVESRIAFFFFCFFLTSFLFLIIKSICSTLCSASTNSAYEFGDKHAVLHGYIGYLIKNLPGDDYACVIALAIVCMQQAYIGYTRFFFLFFFLYYNANSRYSFIL